MPEGDSISRAARTLHRALAGKTITHFETVLPRLARVDVDSPLRGRTIEGVRAIGKHLIIDFSGDLHLRTHMRMNGSWHIYRPGERWQKQRDDMRIVLATADFVAVAFNVPVAEFDDHLPPLGPDILGETFDFDEALRRMRSRSHEEIGNVLLDQQVIAGVGNIWKSETLFVSRINPFARIETLTDEQLMTTLRNARKLMQRSVNATERARYSVYSRGGERCRRCGTSIEYRKQGEDARGTYWCPKCQAIVVSS